jgi:electron transport complex protein RnfD
MWLVSLAAFLAIVQSALTDSFSSLIIAVTAVIAALLCEFVIYFRTEKSGMIRDGSSITSALILVLLLPNHINPIYAAIGAVFAMVVVKYSFGGLGSNWVNPAIGGWLFICFSWPDVFNHALETSPLLSGVDFPIAGSAVDTAVSAFLNKTIFSGMGVELPGGYIDLFSSNGVGIIADRGTLGLLIGSIIIIASQVNRVWIPVVYLGVYGLLIRLFGALPFGGEFGKGDILTGFLSGGTIVAAFFLVSEPVTGPKSGRGALIAVFLASVFAYMFRYQGGEVYGAFFAAALLNVLVPIIRGFESHILYTRRESA